MKKIAVVGGGITGLTAAFHLQQAGLHPLLFEAGATPGGVIRTRAEAGYLIETGPNTLQDNTPEISDLIQALGLEEDLLEADPAAKKRYIVRNGKLEPIPMSPPAFLRSPLLSSQAKIRLFKEPYVAHAKEEESIGSFVRRRLGEEVLDYFVDPFVSGIYAGDPEKLSLEHAFPRIHKVEREHGSIFRAIVAAVRGRNKGPAKKKSRLISFPKGLAELPEKLAEQLGKQIYFETRAESVSSVDGGWQLIASRFGSRNLRDTYDAIIFALPPDVLAALTLESEHPDSLKILQEIRRPAVVSISLGFRRDQVKHPLDGFGMLIPKKEKRGILGVLFPSSLFPQRAPEGHVLLTVFAGGSRQPEVAALDDEALLAHLMNDLRPLLGVSGNPDLVHIHRWPHAIPQYEIGFGRFKTAIDQFEAEHPGLFIAGTARDGVALGQCIASGHRHAIRTIEYLKQQA